MSKLPFYIYVFSHFLFKLHIPVLPNIIMYLNRITWGVYIPPSCSLGRGTKFGYGGSGVVIHARAIIGVNCIINPGVIIGGKSKVRNVPVIGNNVFIAGGAKILGDVKIGDNVIIGANAVVISDIPSNTIAAGIPAKIIKKEISKSDYV